LEKVLKVVPAMQTSQIHQEIEKPFLKSESWEIITFGEQSLQLFIISLDV